MNGNVKKHLINPQGITVVDHVIYLIGTIGDGQIFEKKDSEFTISATVKNTQPLRWWLLSFGHYIEVVEPQFLRKEFAEITRNMNARYKDMAT